MLERLARLLGMSAPAGPPPPKYDPAFGLPWWSVSEWVARNPPIKELYEAKFLTGDATPGGGRTAAAGGASGKGPQSRPASPARPAGPTPPGPEGTAEPAVRTDRELRRAVLEELSREPSLHAPHIGVAVKDGVVTLGGRVPTSAEKDAAEGAARRVQGVKAVANEIEVKPPGDNWHTDEDIAANAARALREDVLVPDDRVKVTVKGGWVTLEGAAEWPFQRGAAERAVRYLTGVTGVSDNIAVKPQASPTELQSASAAAEQC